jgi:hypothetical protein
LRSTRSHRALVASIYEKGVMPRSTPPFSRLLLWIVTSTLGLGISALMLYSIGVAQFYSGERPPIDGQTVFAFYMVFGLVWGILSLLQWTIFWEYVPYRWAMLGRWVGMNMLAWPGFWLGVYGAERIQLLWLLGIPLLSALGSCLGLSLYPLLVPDRRRSLARWVLAHSLVGVGCMLFLWVPGGEGGILIIPGLLYGSIVGATLHRVLNAPFAAAATSAGR